MDEQIKVLFVDDEENILRSLRRLLMDEDFEVFTASSGEEALDILRNNTGMSLIVSDQRMPGLTGVDFFEKSKNIVPDALRIVLTGYADINAAIDAINRGGAYRYITKPWKDDELIQIIRESVQRYYLIKDNKRLSEIVKKQNEELKQWNAQLEYFVQEQTIEIQKKNEELQGLIERVRKNFKNSIIAFSELLELRDKTMRSHSKNVAEVSAKIARMMELSDEEIETITIAALLHDIGKIGISDVLILKDIDNMNADELKEYMLHPVRGQAAVDSIEDLRNAGILIRHHHEWYNGMGFPDSLRSTEIPVGSRIIAMADFIDITIRKIQGDNRIELVLSKVKEELSKRLEPKLYPFTETPAREIYARALPKADVVEIELNPKDLQTGMVISRDVKSGTGLLLLSKGMKLNESNIQTLRRFYQLDPSKGGVFVWVKK